MFSSIYHMTLKLLKNYILGMKTSTFCLSFPQRYNKRHSAMLLNL